VKKLLRLFAIEEEFAIASAVVVGAMLVVLAALQWM